MARLQYDPKLDYYNLLDIAPDADEATIQRLFRQKAKQLHPDVNPDQSEWAKEQFQQINAAYRVLSDPETRYQYDELRRAYKAAQQQKTAYTYNPTPRTAQTASKPPNTVWRHPPRQYPTPQRPVYNTTSSMRNPYRFVLMFVGVVFLINVGFVIIFLSGNLVQSLFEQPTATPDLAIAATPAITMAPSPTLPPFEPLNTCDDPQATILNPQSAQYGADGMPLPLSVRITRQNAFTYEVVLYLANGQSRILKRRSTTQENLSGERLDVSNIDLAQWGVGDYEIKLTVYDQNLQEMTSCSVLVRYVEN